jgi:hypothetical protein
VLAAALLPLALWRPALLILSFAALLAVVVLNRDFLAFLWRQRGPGFAIASVPLHLLYFLCSGLSYLFVRVEVPIRSMLASCAAGAGEPD